VDIQTACFVSVTMRSSIALCLLAIVASPALAARKTLVVCSKDVEKTHSKFFDSLKGILFCVYAS
jgi:hypothetical protein